VIFFHFVSRCAGVVIEMVLPQERKDCLVELKKAFEDCIGIDREDYRVQAVENWFENEVARLHRRVEFQSEVWTRCMKHHHHVLIVCPQNSWLRMLTTRDSSGMTPLHQCVSTGSLEVLDALLRPISGGRGEFTPRDVANSSGAATTLSGSSKSPIDKRRTLNKRTLKQELIKNSTVPGYEWFDVGAVYNLSSGQEVISLDQTPMSMHASNLLSRTADAKLSGSSSRLLLGDTADDIVRSSYNLMSGAALPEAKAITTPAVDYEVIIPWLVRNIHKRSSEMGDRLGATSTEILDELIDIVDMTGTRSLVLPEINKFLGLLGIVVTRDVIKELCHMYPAALTVIEEKWAAIRDQCAEPKDEDQKSSKSSGGKASSSKGSKTRSRGRDLGDSSDDDLGGGRGADHKRRHKNRKSRDHVREDRENDGEDRVLGEDEEFGLDFDKLLDDIVSGRGMRSAVTSNTSFFGATGKKDRTLGGDNDDLDDIAELTEAQERSILEDNCCVELPPVITISSIHKCRRLAVNARDEYGNTPVLLATALSRRDHVDLLLRCGADISILSNEGHSPLAVATDSSVISSLQKHLVVLIKKSKTTVIKHGFVSTLDGATLQHTQTSLLNTKQLISQTCGDPESLLVQLQGLQKKKWGYSQGSLMWALESGTSETIEKLLSAGANPNEADVMGRTVLHECMAMAARIYARDASELEVAASSIFTIRAIAEALILAGADVNRQTSSGRTPMHELFCRGQETDSNSSPSRNSAKTASTSKTMTKLSKGSGEMSHFKAVKKSMERLQSLLVRSLLQWGANALTLDRHGYNAMFYCARENMTNCMIEILKSNIDVYYRCPRGRTALHVACINGSAEVASLICKWDADNKIGVQVVRDSGGKVPRDLIFGMSALSLTTLWQACRDGNSVRYFIPPSHLFLMLLNMFLSGLMKF
jgi:uncharacterized protein